MLSIKKVRKAAAARARASKSQKKIVLDLELNFPDSAIQVEQSEEFECTGWTGGVNYVPSDTDTDTDDDWKDTDLDGHSEDSGNESLESDLEGEDLLDDLENLAKPTPYEHILKRTTTKEWKKAEAYRGLGYNGQSAQRKREIAQELRQKDEQDKITRER